MRIVGLMVVAWLAGCGDKTPPAAGGDATGGGPQFVELDFGEDDEDDMDFDFIKASAECQNLRQLEPSAMMGRLTDPQINCLEDAVRDEDRQTQRKKVSLVLMADAWAKGDKQRWAGVVSRHLEKIDQSDPELCYRYAQYMGAQGPSESEMTIRWADVALENRSVWVGDTYVQRVNALYKLKSKAAMGYWEHMETKLVDNRTEELEDETETARNRAKTLSREWLEYARTAGKDATLAQQMCEQISGSADYCSGDE